MMDAYTMLEPKAVFFQVRLRGCMPARSGAPFMAPR